MTRASGLRRLGETCARHWAVVLAVWLVAVVGLRAAEGAFGGRYSDDVSLPGTRSHQGLQILAAHGATGGGLALCPCTEGHGGLGAGPG